MASASFQQHNTQSMLDYSDDSLDPIQDIFQQFEQANSSSDSYSSSHSHSGASDNGLDAGFDGDLMMMYLNASGGIGADSGAGAQGSALAESFNPTQLAFDGSFGQNQQAQNRASPLSNASSPGFGSHHSAATSHSTPSYDQNVGISPAYSQGPSDFDVSTASAPHALFPYAPYPDPASFRAPASISAKPQQPQPPQQRGYNHVFTPPQPTNSLSPPSSASSADGTFAQQGFIPNEALARMIASAQAQGQAQAQQQQAQQIGRAHV